MNGIEIKSTPDSYTNEVKITIDSNLKREAKKLVASLSSDTSRRRGFLNLIAKTIFLEWLKVMLDLDCHQSPLEDLTSDLSIWEFINGSSIFLGNQRIVLIPRENEDKSSVTIPQEWLMIPQWVGSYYVAADVNLEEDYIEFWGYTTYETIRQWGEIDNLNHHIDLEFVYWETDINLMILEWEYKLETMPTVSPLATVSLAEKEKLFSLAEKSPFPRLSLNFSDWLILLADESFRGKLLASRQKVNLGYWLKKQWDLTIAKGWQNIQQFIEEYFLQPPKIAISFRYLSPEETIDEVLKENPDNISSILLDNLYNYLLNNPLEGERGGENKKSQLISKLSELMNRTDDDERIWSAALCLNILDSCHPLSPVGFAKIIPFESQEFSCAMLVYILAKNQDKVNIFIRIFPWENEVIPSGFAMEILEENGSVFKRIEAGEKDRIIQYKFWGKPGEGFVVRMANIQGEIREEKFVI